MRLASSTGRGAGVTAGGAMAGGVAVVVGGRGWAEANADQSNSGHAAALHRRNPRLNIVTILSVICVLPHPLDHRYAPGLYLSDRSALTQGKHQRSDQLRGAPAGQ